MRSSFFIVAASALLLGSCVAQNSVSPEEVLNKSSVANSGLVSAHIALDVQLSSADVSSGATDGSLNVQGNMQQGGKQLDLMFDSAGSTTSPAQSFTWKAAGRLIVLSDQESYLTVNSLDTAPILPVLSTPAFNGFTNTWFRLPVVATPSATLTPDPRFLRLQSDAIRVTKDFGIDTSDETPMYHYAVAVDPQRLQTYLERISGSGSDAVKEMQSMLAGYEATGEIWIDKQTFLLTKAVWNVAKKDDPAFTLTFSMHLTDAGKPVVITAPSDTKPFPQASLMPIDDVTVLQEF